MALENEEELQRAMAELTKSMQGLGTDTAVADNELTKFSKSVSSVGSAMAGAAGQVMRGGGAFASLNGAIDMATKALGGIVGAIPVIGGAAKEFAQGVGEAAKFVMTQLDDLAKNYNALGESGALAADGIDGVQRQFKQMGLVSLPVFSRALSVNAQGMIVLGGSMSGAADKFSEISGKLTSEDIGGQLVRLGMSFDQVGESAGKYVGALGRMGMTQGKTTDQLTSSTVAYIKEVDLIARVTGASRKQQEDEQQKSLANVQFRAKIADMVDKGQVEEAARLNTYVNGLTGAAADAARAMVTGIPLTNDAAQANMLSGDAIRQNIQAVKDGKEATQAITDTQKGLAQGAKTYRTQLMMAADGMGAASLQALDAEALQNKRNELISKGIDPVEAEKQAQAALAASKGATGSFADAQTKVAGASKDLQELSFNLVKNVVPAVDAFAGSIKRVTGFVNEKFGGPIPPKTGTAPGTPVSKQDLKNLITPIGLGSVAAQFESGAGGAGTISSGKGDLGGKSYGAFQLAGRGGAKGNEVEQFLKASGFDKAFEGLTVGTADFDKKWKDIAATNKDFMSAQQKYAAQTHYDPQMAKLKGAGIDLSGRGMGVQEAVMSTANQYGANTSTIIKALQDKDVGKMDDKAIINAIQDFKAQNVASNFRSSSADVQSGVAKRIEQERAALMAVGPKNGFQPQLANATPGTTLPPAQQAQANNQAKVEDDKLATGFMAINANLENLVRTNQRQLAAQEKQLKQTS